MKTKSRIVSVFLSLVLVIGLMPLPAFAEDLTVAQSSQLTTQSSDRLTTAAATKSSSKSVTLYYDSASKASKKLKATGLKPSKAKWKSSKPKVVSVTKNGTITAKKAGKALITAKQGKKTFKFTVASKKVAINKNKAQVIAGEKLKLTLTGDAIKSAKSANKKVATVSKAGVVKGLKSGASTITLVSKKGKKYKCKVTVKAKKVAVTGVSFNKKELTFAKGDSAVSNPATVAPANATNKKVSYKTSDKSVATIDSNGLVKPVGIGATTLTATSADGGKTATCKVTVKAKKVAVTGVSFKLNSLTLGMDESGFYNEATVLPINATEQGVIYSSSNEKIVKVTQDGCFIPVSIGSATVTAKSIDGDKTAKCSVSVVSSLIPVSGIAFGKKKLTLVAGGIPVINSASITPKNASNCCVLYSSSDSTVAAVDSNGEITPLKTGLASITATSYDGEKKDVCEVTVEEPNDSNSNTIVVTASTKPVTLGSTATLECSMNATESEIQSISWRSSADNGKTWTMCENEGSNTATMNVVASEKGLALKYQCVVADANGAYSTSNPISIQVTNLVATVDTSKVKIGEKASIKCTVEGTYDGNYQYQWQSSKDSLNWANLDGKTSSTLSMMASLDAAALQYRCILLSNQNMIAQSEAIALDIDTSAPDLAYRAHVRDIGWQGYVENGSIAGTTGRALRLEGLRVKLSYPDGSSAITYRAHVQSIGWQGWVSSDAIAGTTGRSLQMEAVQLKLNGDYENLYDLYYRVHVGDIGWLGWAKNGETAGSTGMSKQLEAVQIMLVPKGQQFDTGGIHELVKPSLTYQAHVAYRGWLSNVNEGAVAGTVNEARQMEALRINLKDFDGVGNGILCRAHVSDVGWQSSYVSSGGVSGTTGQDRKLECVCIQLDGNLSRVYDVYYRVHVAEIGWMGWAKNNEKAGTTGGARQVEAIQIKLVVKGSAFDRGGAAYQDLSSATPTPSSGYDAKVSSFIQDGRWCHGTYFSNDVYRKSSPWGSWGCCAYAADFVWEVFGARGPETGQRFTNPNEIRAGDVIRTYHPSYGTHYFVVLYRNGNSLTTAEGNAWIPQNEGGPKYNSVRVSGSAYTIGSFSMVAGYHYM